MFDSLTIARQLTDAGIDRGHADALADAIRQAAEHAGEPGRRLGGSVRDVEPLRVELVREPAQRLLFRELVGRYHYLGHKVPFGAHLRYLVFASRPARAVVGCLQFSSPATCWAWTRVRDILDGKASRVAASMRRAATVAGFSRDTRKPVDTCADYLLKYAPYLHYDRYLAAGYPIATGVIEGACRHLVRDRMELTGARWRLVGAEAVLKLRGLRASGDFDAYWDFHEAREYERNHAQRYADGIAPPVTEPPPLPSSPRLRRVK